MVFLIARDMQRLAHLTIFRHFEEILQQRFIVSLFLCSDDFYGLPPGLVESKFLGESPMQWSSVDIDTELRLARSPTEITCKCPDYLNSDHSSRRQAPVERESLPEILDPVPDAELVSCLKNVTMFMSPEGLAREVARVQLLLAKRRTAGPAKKAGHWSARVVSGRRRHRLRMLIDHLMCRDGKLGKSFLE